MLRTVSILKVCKNILHIDNFWQATYQSIQGISTKLPPFWAITDVNKMSKNKRGVWECDKSEQTVIDNEKVE